MKPELALKKIDELGRNLILDPNPETSRLGAAILTLPVSAAEDEEDLDDLIRIIFMFAKLKMEQKQAIQKLLDLNEN
jgi:hypothetical protein